MKRLIVLLLLCACAAAALPGCKEISEPVQQPPAKGAVSDGAVETGNGSGRGRYCV